MRENGQPQPPAIVVFGAGAGAIEREVLAGIEEEGVPYSVVPQPMDTPGMPAAELAVRAARRSPLQVGVGIGATGQVWIHHAKLAEPLPDLGSHGAADAATARALGHDAARMVVGVPFTSAIHQ